MKIKNQRGFTLVETLLLIVVLLAIGAAVYYAVHNHYTTKSTTSYSSPSPAATATPNPYSGWKAATLQYENVSFKYPANWTIKDSSTAQRGDSVVLSNGSDFQMEMDAGAYPVSDTFADSKITTQPVTFVGQPAEFSFWSAPGKQDTNVALITLDTKSGGVFQSKNVTIPKDFQGYPNGTMDVTISFGSRADGSPVTPTEQTVLASSNYADAKLVVESMRY